MTPHQILSDLKKIISGAQHILPWTVGYSDGSGKYNEEEEKFCLTSFDNCVLHAKMCESYGDVKLIEAAVNQLPRLIAALEVAIGALNSYENILGKPKSGSTVDKITKLLTGDVG